MKKVNGAATRKMQCVLYALFKSVSDIVLRRSVNACKDETFAELINIAAGSIYHRDLYEKADPNYTGRYTV